MCGLYNLTTAPEAVRSYFGYRDRPNLPPRDRIAPTEPIAIVRMERGERRFALVRWGLIPSWMKETKRSRPLINARGETVLEKASFRNAMRRRRCLIPASGFYEWQGDVPGRKQCHLVARPDGGPIAFAGLWEHWMGPGGEELESAAIITTAANAVLQPIHDRMPVIIEPEDFGRWLDAEAVPAEEAATLLKPAADDVLTARPIDLVLRPPRRPAAATEAQPKLL